MQRRQKLFILQPALLVEHIRQPGNTLQPARLLACWRKGNIVCQVELRLRVVAGLEV